MRTPFHPPRRRALQVVAAWLAGRQLGDATAQSAVPGLAFPRDFGAHADSRIEWWYATGWLTPDEGGAMTQDAAVGAGPSSTSASASPSTAALAPASSLPSAATPRHGFQITFFRTRTGVAADNPSRFAARELVFAHAAVSDLAGQRLRHDQRIARSGFDIAAAAAGDARVRLRDWQLERDALPDGASRYRIQADSDSAGFGYTLELRSTQPVLVQGVEGLSRKGPRPDNTSRYYSQPQLAVSGRLRLDGRTQAVRGRAWLDHEWSDALLDPQAVGWDWIGINLFDGSALTAFRLRRADGSTLYAGGSHRGPGVTAARNFASDEVTFRPGRTWTSAATRAVYPVEWEVNTPAGRHRVRALLDAQELDSRQSTGAVYWEGLSELLDAGGTRVGLGYLEMTGYVAALRL